MLLASLVDYLCLIQTTNVAGSIGWKHGAQPHEPGLDQGTGFSPGSSGNSG